VFAVSSSVTAAAVKARRILDNRNSL